MLGLVAVTMLRAGLGGTKDLGDTLLASAQQSLAHGRFEEARIAGLRLALNPEHSQEGELVKAKALQGLGRERDSLKILERLAPGDHPGYAPAHVMLAVTAVSTQPPDFRAALAHLDRALQAEPSNAEAHELAARLAGGRGDWAAVVRHVDQARHEDRADLMLLKATALQSLGLENDAVKLGRKAEGRLRSMDGAADGHNLGVRYSMAISLNLQREYERALGYLLRASQGTPSQRDRLAMADTCLAWSRHLATRAGTDKMKVLEVLEKGIELSPESQDVLAAFVATCEEVLENEATRTSHVRRVLEGGGTASAFLHYYLGIEAWKKGGKATAREHFQMAHDLNPRFTAVTNNLAMAISAVSDKPEELEKALAMLEPLLRADPESPYFLDTRSHLLARLGRYREAARDLELALPRAVDKPGVHGMLAGLYEKLGMGSLSAQHGALARPQ